MMMASTENRPGEGPNRRRNRRTAWIVFSIAAAFFAGVIAKRIFFG